MSALKDLFSPAFYIKLTNSIAKAIPSFNKEEFISDIYTAAFEQMELKARMRHTAKVLHPFLSSNFGKAVNQIEKIITVLRKDSFGEDGLALMFLPDYIEVYGLDDYDNSIKAIEFITQFVSCEFAVRLFILKYDEKMIDQMIKWSLHDNYKVRRLASEGSRPRLPWAVGIPALKKNPAPILPLLENLKNDPSEWVRRSVANNLNDIAKDHPTIILELAQKWKGISQETDAIIKHGSRTLLKQGHADILKHYGLESKNINIADLKIITPIIKIGESLAFSFSLTNNNLIEQKIRLEYAIFYKRLNNKKAKKVFKISEKIYQPNEIIIVNRKQKFVLITTRKFYAGAHQISIIINGEEKAIADFVLMD